MKIKFTNPEGISYTPQRATSGSAGYDLCAATDGGKTITLWNNVTILVGTGVSMAIPNGYVGKLHIRSGLASKGVLLANGVGVIDSDYRGEVKLALTYVGENDRISIKNGDRIGQILIEKTEDVVWEWVEDLDDTERSDGGFGSTGE